jgi:3-dehydro-L-gulonate-6-phosphate decarboxylase
VRGIRALYPQQTILADVRIGEAGSIIARQCYEAGANWVSVLAGASLTTISQVVDVASQFSGEVQIELGEIFDATLCRRWRDCGVTQAIVHRSRDGEGKGLRPWSDCDLARVTELNDLGFAVTIAGGITKADLDIFASTRVAVVIVGRGITGAEDPCSAAREMKRAMRQVWPEPQNNDNARRG